MTKETKKTAELHTTDATAKNGNGEVEGAKSRRRGKTPPPGRCMTFDEALADIREKHGDCIRELAK